MQAAKKHGEKYRGLNGNFQHELEDIKLVTSSDQKVGVTVIKQGAPRLDAHGDAPDARRAQYDAHRGVGSGSSGAGGGSSQKKPVILSLPRAPRPAPPIITLAPPKPRTLPTPELLVPSDVIEPVPVPGHALTPSAPHMTAMRNVAVLYHAIILVSQPKAHVGCRHSACATHHSPPPE